MSKVKIKIFEGCRKRKRKHHKHHHRIVGRFAGAYYINPKGEYVVMSQSVPPSLALTIPLLFTQDGLSVKGPVGEVISSDPTMAPPTLSADGQFANFTSPATGPFQLKWHIADASVAPFLLDLDVSVAPPAPSPIIGSFGTAVPGTTL